MVDVDSETQKKITKIIAKISEVVAVHNLSTDKYRNIASNGAPHPATYDGDFNKAISDYIYSLSQALFMSMIEANLDMRIELPKLRDAGLIPAEHYLFDTLNNFDPEIAKYCHALPASQSL